jgi:pimeloyl-ACP methyl ester carboxylesterase
MTADSADLLLPGPWEHRFVAANGARFHLAESGDGPLVVLLHGFPQFWWAWRHQLPALSEAGYRAVALDLRGFGASDKPPRGYDTPTLAADVAGVIRALGEREAVVVGGGWGGWLAWALPKIAPRLTRAVASLGMAHPNQFRFGAGISPTHLVRRATDQGGFESATGLRPAALREAIYFQLPFLGEHWLRQPGSVTQILTAGSGPDSKFPDQTEAELYEHAMRVPFVPHTSMELFRWAWRSQLRADGRRFARLMSDSVQVPILQLHGSADPWLTSAKAASSARWARGAYKFDVIPGGGHYLAEEQPDQVNERLLSWLAGL